MTSPSAQITVRLQPRASRSELTGMRDGVLIARVTVEGIDDGALREALGLE